MQDRMDLFYVLTQRYCSGIFLTDSQKPDPGSAGQKETVFFGKGMIIAILGIVAVLIILLVVTSGASLGQGATVPAQQCAASTVKYVNENLVQPGSAVTFVSVSESKGLYDIRVTYQSKEIPLYATKDCSLLFTSSMNMNGAKATPAPTKAPVKSARPAVDLYVMAFCPYGTQAETVIRPVYDLLGSKADIHIRYITNVKGSTIDTVSSLHGNTEAKEDLNQLCILKTQPAKFWEYLRMFNEQCYPKWQDASGLETCRKNVTATLGIDTASLTTCTAGADGIALLKADEANSTTYDASASPTLIINGVEYSGARTPDAYKQAICNSFETAPAECSTTLSSTSASAAAGGCG
jgi:protein-disulfide isomerase